MKIAALAACLTLAACSQAVPPTPAAARPPAATLPAGLAPGPIVYAAIGASETVGAGTRDPLRQAWPQLFFNQALPGSAVFYNFGFPGATTAAALTEELPAAVAVHPTVVTIWLNVNDLLASVPPDTYEAQLRQLVAGVRQAGARRILIANTPDLDRLPAYLACNAAVATAFHCPFHQPVPNAATLNALVDAYNAAINRVSAAQGAEVVDLHIQGEVADAHPDWVSSDGFHPNAQGYEAIAAAFQTALRKSTP
jgi:acyl-CoA thioesterase-1